MNTMLNIWHPYQCRMTFNWSRYISFYERGLDRGWGYRDSMQDVLGIMHSAPDKAKERMKIRLAFKTLTAMRALFISREQGSRLAADVQMTISGLFFRVYIY